MTDINPNMTVQEWIEAAKKELADNIVAMKAGTAEIVRLRQENKRLSVEVQRLLAWKDLVPVREIGELVKMSPYFESTVSTWLDSIGVQP